MTEPAGNVRCWHQRVSLRVLGALALMSFVVHGGNHVLHGDTHNLLWLCNVTPLVLALGCWLRRARLSVVALLWLLFGSPIWLLDLWTGAGLILTSFLPHVLCVAVGVLAAIKLGWPRRSWAWATAGSLLLVALARLLTDARHNVNVAFSVWPGWEKHFPRHELLLGAMIGTGALLFLVIESLWLRFAGTNKQQAR